LGSRILYLVPLYTALMGWMGFVAIFVFRRRLSRGHAKKTDRASMIGILLQGCGSGLAWWVSPRPFTPILPLGFWFHRVSAVLVIVLVIFSLWMTSAAVHALGKQWSFQARVLEDHALIREGPYRFVRHPIYTGMFGMILAAGLAYDHWIGLLFAVVVFSAGTAIRVKSEEKLLREQFGIAFDNYARDVPAVIPLKWRFRVPAK
jgi:protein-S-isoprenylcysteine O-methyltransferase Ste14